MENKLTYQSMNSYVAVPPSGKGPGVLVLHAWWGLNDFIREVCDRLAQEGYVALAPDMFAGKVAQTVEEAEQLVSGSDEIKKVPPILLSAVERLGKHPAVTGSGLGTIGFSFGGYWALWLAGKKPDAIRAVTIFYSTGDGDIPQSKAAFQGHYAEKDPFEPEEGVKELESSLKAANRPVTFYTYPGTGHWFFENDRKDAFDAPAAKLAWERTLTFLREHLDGAQR